LRRRPLGAVLHSSNEPVELSQWLCHDNSTINIVLELLLLLLMKMMVFTVCICSNTAGGREGETIAKGCSKEG